MEDKAIGLIGVGLLGSAIAARLQSQGLRVLGFDSDASKTAQLASPHQGSASAQEVFRLCDAIILSLPTSDVATAVVADADIRPSTTIIDTTTGKPDEMVALATSVTQRKARYAEATVAGSSTQMRDGQCVIFLGCDEDAKPAVQSVTSRLSDRTYHLGAVGSASRFKLVHNLILGLNRAVLAEALVFGETLGFEPSTTLEILKTTPAASNVMQTKGEKMVSNDYQTQARLSQHLKDVRLILQLAESHGSNVPLSSTHRSLLEKAESMGFGDADNSAIIEAIRGSNAAKN